ncbi:long-chain fatty acid transport protein 3 [Spea bombifrons]|uniref:long-chain fatty acid transport protein 3 n=1 Tax=Spea bombifrons TaxID=233779 RepID=UPI002349E78C|nr:long-chain fatty acid transport protein 3 [Spea bombifrons]
MALWLVAGSVLAGALLLVSPAAGVAMLAGLAVWPLLGRVGPLVQDARFAMRAARVKRQVRGWMASGARSLPELFELRARSQPERPFLRYREETLSYGELEARSNRAAAAMRGALNPGDTVALLLANEPRFLSAWFGLAKLGAVVAFLNCNVRRGALSHCLRASGARGLITSQELFEAVQEILPELRGMGIKIWVMGPGEYPEDVGNLQKMMDESSEAEPPSQPRVPRNPTDTAICIFTSGTTGLPKAARISHLKTLMCCAFYQLCSAHSDDIIYMSLPLYHKSGALLGVGGCIGIGASLVLKERFSASQFWSDCRKYNVTVFQYIGELCRYLTNQPQCADEVGHRVRLAAGSGLRPDVWREFSRRFGKIRIFETYGMTEFNISFFNYTGSPGAVGRGSFLYKQFCPFDLIKFDTVEDEPVRDAHGRCQRVVAGETGLLISPVTPMSPFLGYVGSRELSEKKLLRDVFRAGDCFFNTGDLMMQDELGFVYFRDRTGDTFRWKGENVATTEVSEILSGLYFLQEVNVFGVTVPGHEGRAGMAAVTLRPGHRLDLERLYTHVVESIPSYARPRFIRLMEAMECTGTFKQQKLRLVQDGFSPLRVREPLYVLDESRRSYRPLTEDLYHRIMDSEFRV